MELLLTDSRLTCLCSPAVWAEGPVWLAQQQCVIFSDVKGNRMFRWQPDGEVTLWRSASHYANGNASDAGGRLITCEHGRRAISRTEQDGSVTLLVDKIEGRRFNSPNDVVVRSDGSIWFTDPPYGIIGDEEGYKSESQIIGCYVYCFTPWDGHVYIAASDTQRPNGLAFSPDEKTLYVADMSIVDFPAQGRREIRAYPVDGYQLGSGHRIADISPGFPDGFCVDYRGNVFCSCADGVVILSPQGRIIGKIPVPERVSNCTFGGPENDELFITATRSLYHIRLNTRGALN
ncbi:SMP-30/gluconolactonase/LRE family protein [Salmonella enterica]|nr:SMP-30/gluconolactonase/LRE family protein [Salmonella enterica]EDS5052156.1 SMP-30/gluconolactonase/LRE family protein [Salmonella enterica]